MASLGSVTSLGVGSGFDLQQMLEDFRSIDEQPIDSMKDEVAVIDERLTKYDDVKAKLIDIKSHALTLSLESNFLERTVASSDETIATATVLPGTAITSSTLDITRLAAKSSWQTAGVAGTDTSTYIPTIQETTVGLQSADSAGIVSEDELMTITYGSGDTVQSINLAVTPDMSLNDIANAVNIDSGNQDGQNGTYVTASTYQDEEGLYHMRIASTAEGSTEANRVMVTVAPESLSMKAPPVEITYSLGDGEPVTVSVEADTTFNGLADQINSDVNNAGVTAKVINDGSSENPYRLVVTANQTGEDSRISISGIQMTEVQGAEGASLNAEVSVDGILYQRQSNTGVSDIIQGVTLSFEKEGEVTVSVGKDNELIRTEIIGLLDSYNEAVQEIKANSGYDSDTEEFGLLATSYGIKGLPVTLNGLFSNVIETNQEITSLFSLGVTFNRDGSLSVDEAQLDSALASSGDAVTAMFVTDEDTGRQGLGDIINDALRQLTSSNGVIQTETDFSNTEQARLEDDISEATARLDKRYDLLARQFVELDMYIGQMNAQSEYLTSVFSSSSSSSKSKS